MIKEKRLVYDVEENPKHLYEWIFFAMQQLLAILVATITVPLLTGLPIAPTVVSAGIGTLFYLLVTKRKSPVFLSSSFAYISPICAALAVGMIGDAGGMNYLAVMIGMTVVAAIYCIIALLIKVAGTKWLNKLLPPVVIGPIIMVIGLSLAGSAVNNLANIAADPANYNLIHIACGLFALLVTALCAHYGRGKFIGLIPFFIGMVAGYGMAAAFTLTLGKTNPMFAVIDFTPVTSLFGENFQLSSIFNYNLFVPNHDESFIFLRFEEIKRFDWGRILEVVLLFAPVSLVTVCEHIGDHKNLGNTIGRDLVGGEPGLTRTLIGDGVATGLGGCLSGVANTTYGESVAVVGTTKVASANVILLTAILVLAAGFLSPFTAALQTIPACITGGVSLVLYGFIASSGVKMLMEEKVDFNKPRSIFIAAAILIAGIGGLQIKFDYAAGKTIVITSTAVAMFLGIILNTILVEKKDKKSLEVLEEAPVEESTETTGCCCGSCTCEKLEKRSETPVEESTETTGCCCGSCTCEKLEESSETPVEESTETTSTSSLEVYLFKKYSAPALKKMMNAMGFIPSTKSYNASVLTGYLLNEDFLWGCSNKGLYEIIEALNETSKADKKNIQAHKSLRKDFLIKKIMEFVEVL